MLSRLASVPRLTRNAITRLLDLRSQVAVRPMMPLTRNDRIVGCVETVVWQREKVQLSGWCLLPGLQAGFAGQPEAQIDPGIERRDVQALHRDAPLVTGFEVEIARGPRSAPVAFELADTGIAHGPSQSLAPPSRHREMSSRIAALPSALAYAFGHRRDILRFIRTGDPGLSVALRDAFGFGAPRGAAPLVPDDLFAEPQAPMTAPTRDTVLIVPIYNAPENVARLLDRLATTVDIPHHLLLIDDGSDDPAMPALLADFASQSPETVTIETLPENRGFVAAVNHGLSVARDMGEHVILINSDTLPPKGWASRLIAPILDDSDIASVTPVSNTAEIASIPAQGVTTALSPELVDKIDTTARRFGPAHRSLPIPTGIGFAMAMNRRFLDKIGDFDTIFGRGYGEEVDWCQKARQAGGRHVLAPSVFIGHEGGASFGSKEKSIRVHDAGKIISSRYPDYDAEVRSWAEAAPHATQRIALTLAWLDAVSPGKIPVFIGHTLGGGAEMSLAREISEALEGGAPGLVVLRAGGSAPWRLEIIGQGFHHKCRVGGLDLVEDLLAPLSAREIIYSCGVGARNPTDVPALLQRLSNGEDHGLALRLHDFFTISPSYCLLDDEGRYRGLPDANAAADVGPEKILVSKWRALWTPIIERADEVTAYSESSAEIFQEAYPISATKLAIRPHALPADMPETIAPGGSAIGILGGINQAKGAEILVALAKHFARAEASRRIVLVGELDPNYRLPPPHLVTGSYDRSDIAPLAKAHNIGIWLIPSIWPETFSFTTREALATGLPVVTFDLGAQAEAARAAPNGHVMETAPDDIPALANALEDLMAAESAARR